mmetsp:Transcript_10104/g.16964  ORF Transcript_10104/g.16964 Transcript_10104/m.16964 type:complete len:304 (+) Transcript_10104:55-966(+)
MATPSERFSELSKMKYADQAIWFLNGFWAEEKQNAETIFKAYQKFVELDKESKKLGEAGNELDHFWSAKFLEDFDQALTATARKEALRKIDVDSNGNISLIEYCTWKYNKKITDVENAPQGDNQEALNKAQRKLEEVQKALDEVQTSLAKLKLEKEKLAKLKVELEAALAELKKEEELYKKKCDDLQTKIDNPSTSGMQKAKAKNELAQLKAEDPLPLRRATITQEAALRKVGKQKKKVEQDENALQAELAEAQKKVDAAAALGGDNAPGLLWWMQRQMWMADARLPTSKQKYDHKKPFEYNP